MDGLGSESDLGELGIEQAFSVGAFSRRPILNGKDLVFVPQQQYGIRVLNDHAPLPPRQRRQRHHRNPVVTGRRWLFGDGNLGRFTFEWRSARGVTVTVTVTATEQRVAAVEKGRFGRGGETENVGFGAWKGERVCSHGFWVWREKVKCGATSSSSTSLHLHVWIREDHEVSLLATSLFSKLIAHHTL